MKKYAFVPNVVSKVEGVPKNDFAVKFQRYLIAYDECKAADKKVANAERSDSRSNAIVPKSPDLITFELIAEKARQEKSSAQTEVLGSLFLLGRTKETKLLNAFQKFAKSSERLDKKVLMYGGIFMLGMAEPAVIDLIGKGSASFFSIASGAAAVVGYIGATIITGIRDVRASVADSRLFNLHLGVDVDPKTGKLYFSRMNSGIPARARNSLDKGAKIT